VSDRCVLCALSDHPSAEVGALVVLGYATGGTGLARMIAELCEGHSVAMRMAGDLVRKGKADKALDAAAQQVAILRELRGE
jgi:hypothetical protein